ncbi:MAG: sugar transferase [Puniceicoccales bacterium]|jgi:lipopolysaccharide/colanic/teichoic acid biosynthesis glycosyltransferase|nr:sugar transferase [Puniceicoccales bacterium]
MYPKRLFDILFASAVLALGSVPLLLLAVLVRWRLGTPVLFVQERPGKGGRLFKMVKFRTMTDACDAGGKLLPDKERITPLGNFLRRTSLDEFPGFWNVLRGDMSVVGPRPLLPRYLSRYTPEQARRHEVPPGITGWTQVNGRNTLSWEKKFEYDVWYVDNRSFRLDVKIVLMTVAKVIRRDDISAANHATMPEFLGTQVGGDKTRDCAGNGE